MTKVAVILSGCGYLDGAEVREAVITLLELDKAGADVECFAPDIEQMHVVNHLTGEEESGAKRNVLTESARIARGKIKPLIEANVADFDALILPGGFGAAKNLSDLAIKGADATVLPEFKELILSFLSAKKPIGAICISPAVLVAAVSKDIKAEVTIGTDNDGLIGSLGGVHHDCPTNDFYYDEINKISSCSAYMSEAPIKDVARGIEKVVAKTLELASA